MMPLKEKLRVLAYLQKNVSNAGSFLLSHLKTKNQYQLSFVNGLAVKVISQDVDDCLEVAIREVGKIYFDEHKKSFWDSYDKIRESALLQEENDSLKNRITHLEEKYDKLLKKYIPIVSNVAIQESTESEMSPSPDEKSTTPLQKIINIMDKKGRGRPKQKKDNRELRSRKSRKRRECKFTEKQLNREMKRINPNLDVDFIENGNTARYREERQKAYKRLHQNNVKKLNFKKDNLKIKENKYGITKSDVLKDMKRVLKGKLKGLNSAQYIKNWRLAKARVWNKRYHEEKNKTTSVGGWL